MRSWIDLLNLIPHPEGGYYRETYRSTGVFTLNDAGEKRHYSTAIYFLLEAHDKSKFHRIKSDEIWHYHAGGELTIYVLTADGLVTHTLGADIEHGNSLQVLIPAHHWFGARVTKGSYVLSGCTVSPGFEFSDFELADRQALLSRFPDQSDMIRELT